MSGWKDISESAEKKRAAAFEAQMLAMLAKEKSAATDKLATPDATPPIEPARDGIQITVTAKGQSTHYNNLETVPAPVRQQILNAWQPAAPPVMRIEPTAPVSPRPRPYRMAGALNLFLPGAGQIYVGQPLIGSVLALGFLVCFGAMLVIFVRAYANYLQLSTSGDILEAGKLEQLSNAFPIGMLIGLLVGAITIYVASAIHLSRSRPRQ